MASTSNAESTTTPDDDREAIVRQVTEAAEPIAKFWPMRTFVHHNPLHGFEHMPFDDAIRAAKALFGGLGYLPNEEYRQLYQDGRITDDAVDKAFVREGPTLEGAGTVTVGAKDVTPADVWRLHLLYGFGRLEPTLLPWTIAAGGALTELQADLPADAKRRLSERPAEPWLNALWAAALHVRGIGYPQSEDDEPLPNHEAWANQAEPAEPPAPGLPPHRTVSDWLDAMTGGALVGSIDDQMIKWVSGFVDEGMAGWAMPERERGFYASWRELAQHDLSGRFLGIKRFADKVRALPEAAEDAIASALRQLEIPPDRWVEYLARQLAHLPGWTGFVRWRGKNPEYPTQAEHPIDPAQYLAVRLFYEVELAEALCRRTWSIAGTVPALESHWAERVEQYDALVHAHGSPDAPAKADPNTTAVCGDAWRLFRLAQFLELAPAELRALDPAAARTLLQWLDAFPEDEHGPVFLEAYEDGYREDTVSALKAHAGTVPKSEARPLAQLAFCIDVRSEPFRRHVESAGAYETFGFAGFFGVAIDHQEFDSDGRVALCPVILAPAHASTEAPRANQPAELQHYASGSRWADLGREMFNHLKANPVTSLILVDMLGLFTGLGVLGKTVIPRAFKRLNGWVDERFSGVVDTEISVARIDDATAPTAEAKANFVEGALRTMGLTANFARFIVSCGHGSVADNNPYFGALDCGACGGNPGDPNGRVFAAMANNPEVRKILNERGLPIPDDTWFLGGKHNTTTDAVTFYDVADVPESHAEDLRTLIADLGTARNNQALERCARTPGAPSGITPEAAGLHVEDRSADWANPRPEWGLAGNAGFICGRRTMTKGLDLGGRVFLQSYDPIPDTDGGILEQIMMSALVVGEWINMEHYFSAVDVWAYGSGSKVIHNVVSGVGLMLGAQSDLQTGLPLQTVNDGAIHYHEPVRLLAIIEAPPDRISAAIGNNELLQDLFHNGWMNLVAMDPETSEVSRYRRDATWEAMQ